MTSADLDARPAARQPSGDTVGFRMDIEGLRALAVLLVIGHHLGGHPSGGYLGVDVFFVISGFLITRQLVQHLSPGGYPALAHFYRRRVRRIFPQALLVIGATLLASAVLLPTSRLRGILGDGLWSLFFAGNWRMIDTETDYFQLGVPPSPFQHYWSLGVEEQFYVVWPAVIAALALLGLVRRHRAGAITAAALALFVLSAAWAWHRSGQAPDVAYYATTTRGWELAIGAAAAAAGPWLARLPRRVALVRPLALLVIAASTLVVAPTSQMPWPSAVPAVLATAVLLVTGHPRSDWRDHRWWDWPLVHPVAQFIGRLSFALYLWHFPVIVLLASLLEAGTAPFVVASLLLTATLSVLTFFTIEQPIRRSSWLEPRGVTGRRARGRLAVVVVVLLLGIGSVSWQVHRADAPPTVRPTGGECFGAAAALDPDRCPPGGELSPSLDVVEVDNTEAFDCWTLQAAPLRACTYGTRGAGALDVTFIGDSHAASLLPALRLIAEQQRWQLTVYTGYGCQWRVHVPRDECLSGVAGAEEEMLSEPRPDLIITTAARWVVPAPLDDGEEYAARWRRATAVGVPVVAIEDNPEVSEEALACLQRVGFDPETDRCTTPRDVAYADFDPLAAAVDLTPGSALVPLGDVYCPADACPTVIGDVLVYRDTADHLSDTFSRSLVPVLMPRLLEAVAEARGRLRQ